MGCHIQYDERDGVLRAVVSGKSSLANAAWIARQIFAQAGERMRVLIDVRRLHDRLGTLGALTRAQGGYRVAVVDVAEHDRYYALHEASARERGYSLRCFSNPARAADWLRGAGPRP